MISAVRKLIVLVILIIPGVNLRAQTDSLAIDSITNRIKEILEVYNSYSVFVDTSDYIHFHEEANNFNLQIASSLGACNEIIRFFVRGADVNTFVGETARPLHHAVNSGKWEAVEILLLLGADPDSHDMFGNTPLVNAVRANTPDIAEKLIRYGANMEEGDRFNSTPLHHAAAIGNFLMADMLLYYDSPTELHDSEGNTPLMAGVCFGYHEIADLLLQSGADPNAADRKGYTPLMAASQKGDTLMMSILINAGASLYSVDNQGLDALGCAVIASQEASVRYLLERGNRWNRADATNADPVTLANTYGRSGILRMMLDHGIEGKRTFAFNELSFSAGTMITSIYSMAGGAVSVASPGIHTGITMGAWANPVNQRLLVEDNDTYYQYRVKSTVIYTGLYREFQLSSPYSRVKIKSSAALSVGYRFHSLYEGTEERPDNSLLLSPSADIGISIRNLGVNAGVSYLRMPFHRAGPLWMTLRATFTFTRPADNYSIKKVRLYSYEQN
ncbi:MAG: hypothetical protein GX646_12515 [Bacteroidales bacterium]|nr:hypothetical protein [Bacteroidales bacterium]